MDKILRDKTLKDGVRVFLVRWEGHGTEEHTWETEVNLRDGANEIVNEYLACKVRLITMYVIVTYLQHV